MGHVGHWEIISAAYLAFQDEPDVPLIPLPFGELPAPLTAESLGLQAPQGPKYKLDAAAVREVGLLLLRHWRPALLGQPAAGGAPLQPQPLPAGQDALVQEFPADLLPDRQLMFVAVAGLKPKWDPTDGVRQPVPLVLPDAADPLHPLGLHVRSKCGDRCAPCNKAYSKACRASKHVLHKITRYSLAFAAPPAGVLCKPKEFTVKKRRQTLWVPTAPVAELWHVQPARPPLPRRGGRPPKQGGGAEGPQAAQQGAAGTDGVAADPGADPGADPAADPGADPGADRGDEAAGLGGGGRRIVQRPVEVGEGEQQDEGAARERQDAQWAMRMVAGAVSAPTREAAVAAFNVLLQGLRAPDGRPGRHLARVINLKNGDGSRQLGLMLLVVHAALEAEGLTEQQQQMAPPPPPPRILSDAAQGVVVALFERLLDEFGAAGFKRLCLQADFARMDTVLHTCCRYTLLRVLDWLLPRLDAAALTAKTQAHWCPLHTAARAPHRRLAVDAAEKLLRRGEALGLFTQEAMAERGTSALLSDLSAFNRFYRTVGGRDALDEALLRVWPSQAGRPEVREDISDEDQLAAAMGRLALIGGAEA
ncbi:hypothetical protein HXX76_003082 [Chlamydomonas incerta]|uniref:Uncharacterized protein n=1 Tax=Chlamydomonas incerta TaxID=51695 RepID=A0A835W6Q1_CHLIN|nr:hypothetical protein HXX76_003082 [Chlamydomonas incerta]|eukprot:KAG2441460.1 hypothetical protein HXX76_003082 [Chlamydomonas incerta]